MFRDSKQFTGLCNCQSRDVKAVDFAFNMSLSAINVARQFGIDYPNVWIIPLKRPIQPIHYFFESFNIF